MCSLQSRHWELLCPPQSKHWELLRLCNARINLAACCVPHTIPVLSVGLYLQ